MSVSKSSISPTLTTIPACASWFAKAMAPREMSDLEGKKVGTKIGSTSYDFLTKNLDDNDGVTPYPGSSDMYMALMSGAVDAVFYDAPNVGYFASTRGKEIGRASCRERG